MFAAVMVVLVIVENSPTVVPKRMCPVYELYVDVYNVRCGVDVMSARTNAMQCNATNKTKT